MSAECSHDDLLRELQELREEIKPIVETYQTVTTIGRWAKALLVFASIVIGVILGFRSLYK